MASILRLGGVLALGLWEQRGAWVRQRLAVALEAEADRDGWQLIGSPAFTASTDPELIVEHRAFPRLPEDLPEVCVTVTDGQSDHGMPEVYPAFWGHAAQPTTGRTRGQDRAREARYRRYEKYRGRTPARCALTYHTPMVCMLDGWMRCGQPVVDIPRGRVLPGGAGAAPHGWVHAQCADSILDGGQHLQAMLRPTFEGIAAAAAELRRRLEPVARIVAEAAEQLGRSPLGRLAASVAEQQQGRQWSPDPVPAQVPTPHQPGRRRTSPAYGGSNGR